MTFIEQLKAHIGGLIRIKTGLYWYKVRKWDGAYERVYLLLDALDGGEAVLALAGESAEAQASQPSPLSSSSPPELAVVLLSIDGTHKWVWVYSGAVELVE